MAEKIEAESHVAGSNRRTVVPPHIAAQMICPFAVVSRMLSLDGKTVHGISVFPNHSQKNKELLVVIGGRPESPLVPVDENLNGGATGISPVVLAFFTLNARKRNEANAQAY
jgi:hypothetical protein